MNNNRSHRAVSNDGTEIVGSVHGQGPPLVLQHGAMDHGEISWGPALPYLTDHYTCHLPSLRNRGRSGHSDDSTPPRLVEDLTAYADSLGQPVALVGLSLGGALALEAAHRAEQVTAVVAYEPPITAIIDEATLGQFTETVRDEAQAVQEGRLADGVRRFGRFVGNDEELAALETAGAFEIMGPNAPADLAAIQQGSSYQGPRGTNPDALARLDVPLLLIQGARSNAGDWFHACVDYVASHVPHAEIKELPGHGHLAPMVDPEPVAAEVLHFLARSAVTA
jgi:pimeloyl-ACP methyl ester carboxylesterase